jgi:hypothetical protein
VKAIRIPCRVGSTSTSLVAVGLTGQEVKSGSLIKVRNLDSQLWVAGVLSHFSCCAVLCCAVSCSDMDVVVMRQIEAGRAEIDLKPSTSDMSLCCAVLCRAVLCCVNAVTWTWL